MKKSRTYLIALAILLLLAVVAPFFIPGPTGKPLLSFERVKQILSDQYPVARQVDRVRTKVQQKAEDISEKSQPEEISQTIETPSEQPPETLFKWRDKNGTWHFTNRPPPAGVDYTVIKWAGATKPVTDQTK